MIELYLLSEGSTGFINSRLGYHLSDFLLFSWWFQEKDVFSQKGLTFKIISYGNINYTDG